MLCQGRCRGFHILLINDVLTLHFHIKLKVSTIFLVLLVNTEYSLQVLIYHDYSYSKYC